MSISDVRYAKIVERPQGAVIADLFDSALQYSVPTNEAAHAGSIVIYSISNDAVKVESVIAVPDSARAAIWLALSEYGVKPDFPGQVDREVRLIAENPRIDDVSIPDLSHLPFITIDNVDSMDLDQAMHISASDQGYTLHYALADAAFFVRQGSALFDEALRRGASYYVPGFSIPMLPRELSENLVSLNEGVARRALVFIIKFDAIGSVVSTVVQQSRIISAAKLSYTGVEEYYRDASSSTLNNMPYTPTLEALRDLGLLRIEEAKSRNVVEYDRDSVEINLSQDGSIFEIENSSRLQVEKYNEQISLVCNSEGARILESVGLESVVQAVYRVHDSPDEDRLKKFSRLLKGLIRHYALPEALWVWRWRDGKFGQREFLSDYLHRLRDNNVDTELLSVVQRHALMLSPASRFSPVAAGHHSLKLDQYARFSSPMREIAGIYTHREYLQYARHSVSGEEPANDEQLREKVIQAANRSKEIQKKLNKAMMKKAIDQLFEGELKLPEKQREIWHGTVISLRRTRVYVRLSGLSIIVKVYLRELGRLKGTTYKLDRSSVVCRADDGSEFALGQQIELRVQNYSDSSLRWLLVPV